MEEKIKINLISRLMKMTPDAIRFYEKKKIISPERGTNGKYREYSMLDVKKLYDCKNLRNINFSIKEVENIMNSASKEENNQKYLDKRAELEKSIAEQQMMLEKINRAMQAESMYEQHKNAYQIREKLDQVFYCYSKNNHLNYELVNSPIYEQVMEYHNLFSCTALLDITEGIKDASFDFGFSIERKRAIEKNISTDNPAKCLKSKHYIYTVILTESFIQLSDLSSLFKWATENNYKLDETILCKLINSYYDEGEEKRYYEIFCPIAQ